MSPRTHTRLIAAFFFVAAVALLVVPEAALAQATPIQITAGDTATLELDGNPSTGYAWVLQEPSSDYEHVVGVEVLGYTKAKPKPGERPVLGAPQKFQVLLTGIAAGRVGLVFNYMKGGTPAPAKTQEFAVEVLDNGAPGQAPGGASGEDSSQDLFANPDVDDENAGTDP
jgi:predicted secreted protein